MDPPAILPRPLPVNPADLTPEQLAAGLAWYRTDPEAKARFARHMANGLVEDAASA